MGATSVTGIGWGAVENSFPRIQNNIKLLNLAADVTSAIANACCSSNLSTIVSYTDSVISLPVHQISESDSGKLFLLDHGPNGFITLPELSTTTIGQTFRFLTTVRPDQFFIQCYPFSDLMTGSLTLYKNGVAETRTFAASATSNKIEYGTNNSTGGIIGSYVVAISLGTIYWIQGDVITDGGQTVSNPFGTNT
jgi:hypothetical protein